MLFIQVAKGKELGACYAGPQILFEEKCFVLGDLKQGEGMPA
jgi:hypothetical protein